MKKDSDLLQERFGPCAVWVARNGKTTFGQEPHWHREQWPMHTAADMAKQSWNPKEGKRAKSA